MAENVRRRILWWRLGLAVFVLANLFWRLVPTPVAPVETRPFHAPLTPVIAEPGRDLWSGPDWVLAVACAVVLRRPEYLPILLLAALVLLEDLLTVRPIGLWAALVLVVTEFLRARAAFSREVSLLGEWLLVALMIGFAFSANRLILGLFFVPQPALAPVVVQALATIAAYPLVLAVLRFGFGLRKPATGELDPMGQKL